MGYSRAPIRNGRSVSCDHADDQRTVIGELTQKGRALIADVFPDHVEQVRQLMSGLSVADKHAAATLLPRLTTGASADQ